MSATIAGAEIRAGTSQQVKYHGRWYTVMRFIASQGQAYRVAEGRSVRHSSKAILLRNTEQYPVRENPHTPRCFCRAADYDRCTCNLTVREFAAARETGPARQRA
jgi:hypothetical protein